MSRMDATPPRHRTLAVGLEGGRLKSDQLDPEPIQLGVQLGLCDGQGGAVARECGLACATRTPVVIKCAG